MVEYRYLKKCLRKFFGFSVNKKMADRAVGRFFFY